MYFSRLTLKADADPRRLVSLSGYREHQALWQVFDPDPNAKRDFLFRREGITNRLAFLVVSRRQPLFDQGLWRIESKDYRPKLSAGQRLAFKLRVNPTVTRNKESGQRARIDLVMDQKIQSGWQGQPAHKRAPLQQLVQQAGEQWLEKRQERLGITLDTLTADGYRQHRSYKRGVSKPMLYSSCDLEGAITVIDPDALRTALYHGVGAAKALGCGLLLIKPM